MKYSKHRRSRRLSKSRKSVKSQKRPKSRKLRKSQRRRKTRKISKSQKRRKTRKTRKLSKLIKKKKTRKLGKLYHDHKSIKLSKKKINKSAKILNGGVFIDKTTDQLSNETSKSYDILRQNGINPLLQSTTDRGIDALSIAKIYLYSGNNQVINLDSTGSDYIDKYEYTRQQIMSNCVLPLYNIWLNKGGKESDLNKEQKKIVGLIKSELEGNKPIGVSDKKKKFIEMTRDYSIVNIIETIDELIKKLPPLITPLQQSHIEKYKIFRDNFFKIKEYYTKSRSNPNLDPFDVLEDKFINITQLTSVDTSRAKTRAEKKFTKNNRNVLAAAYYPTFTFDGVEQSEIDRILTLANGSIDSIFLNDEEISKNDEFDNLNIIDKISYILIELKGYDNRISRLTNKTPFFGESRDLPLPPLPPAAAPAAAPAPTALKGPTKPPIKPPTKTQGITFYTVKQSMDEAKSTPLPQLPQSQPATSQTSQTINPLPTTLMGLESPYHQNVNPDELEV